VFCSWALPRPFRLFFVKRPMLRQSSPPMIDSCEPFFFLSNPFVLLPVALGLGVFYLTTLPPVPALHGPQSCPSPEAACYPRVSITLRPSTCSPAKGAQGYPLSIIAEQLFCVASRHIFPETSNRTDNFSSVDFLFLQNKNLLSPIVVFVLLCVVFAAASFRLRLSALIFVDPPLP